MTQQAIVGVTCYSSAQQHISPAECPDQFRNNSLQIAALAALPLRFLAKTLGLLSRFYGGSLMIFVVSMNSNLPVPILGM